MIQAPWGPSCPPVRGASSGRGVAGNGCGVVADTENSDANFDPSFGAQSPPKQEEKFGFLSRERCCGRTGPAVR